MTTQNAGKYAITFKAVFALLSVTLLLLPVSCAKTRHADRFNIPDGYTGWVIVHYELSKSPSTKIKNGVFVYDVPKDGIIRTSSKMEEGSAQNEYFYESGNRVIPLMDGGDPDYGKSPRYKKGIGIWGGVITATNYNEYLNGRKISVKGHPIQYFFVGSEAEYNTAKSPNL